MKSKSDASATPSRGPRSHFSGATERTADEVATLVRKPITPPTASGLSPPCLTRGSVVSCDRRITSAISALERKRKQGHRDIPVKRRAVQHVPLSCSIPQEGSDAQDAQARETSQTR